VHAATAAEDHDAGPAEVTGPSTSEPSEPPWQLTPTPPWPPSSPTPRPAPQVAPPPPGAVPPPGAPSYAGTVAPAPPDPPVAPVPPGPAGYGAPPPPAGAAQPGYAPSQVPVGGHVQPIGVPGGPVVVDPHGLGLSVSRLSGGARRAGKVALGVLAAVLAEGDVVAVVVQGRFRGEAGVAALVEGRVVLVNDRQWKPDVVVLPVDGDLTVHGWQDERTAALTFVVGDRQEFIERIGDRGLAIEMAQRIRHAQGGPDAGPAAPPVPPPPSPMR
jgi:hypothetical protein